MTQTPVSSHDARDLLLEREREVAAIAQALQQACRGDGGALLIEGSAGIGKTALIAWAGEQAERQDLHVLCATGRELERAFPFGIALQLFEPSLANLDSAERDTVLSGAASPVAALLGVGAAGPPLPDQGFAIIHGLYWLAASLSERLPLALVVDDLHWADAPSLQMLAYLAPRASELPLALLMSRRTGESSSAGIDWLASGNAVDVIRPATLSFDATAEIVRSIVGTHANERVCAACHEVTGGNPFLARELARTMAQEALELDEAGAERVTKLAPASVSRATLSRIQALDPEARALATAVAVLERAELRHAAALAELDEARAADAATALAAAGVLAGQLPLQFLHPLLRTAVYSDLPAPTREISHRRAAHALAEARANPDIVASHLLECEPRNESWAVEALRKAAHGALARGAPQIAGRLLKRALAESPEHPDREELLLERAQAYQLGGHPKMFDALEEVVETSRESMIRCRALADFGTAQFLAGNLASAFEAARRGLDALDGRATPDLEARLLFAYLSAGYGNPRVAREAWTVLEETSGGSSVMASSKLIGRALLLAFRGEPRETVAEAAERGMDDERLLELGTEGFCFRCLAAWVLFITGHDDRASTVYEELLEVARKRGSPLLRGIVAHFSAWQRLHQGLLPETLADTEVMIEYSPPPWHMTAALARLMRCEARIDQGDLATARADMESAEELLARQSPNSSHYWHPFVRSRLRLEDGDPKGAYADSMAAGRGLLAVGIESPAWWPWRSRAALACARRGEFAEAGRLCEEELRLARRSGVPRAIGIALRAAGLVTEGEESIAKLREAAEILAASPARLEHARALVDLGGALRRANRRSEATGPLRQGIALAHRCGATALVEQATWELKATGARPRRIVTSGREALTASELRICRLAAQGLSNREIAERLFITRRTVETHLTHAYGKLAIAGRDELSSVLGEDAPMSPAEPKVRGGSTTRKAPAQD